MAREPLLILTEAAKADLAEIWRFIALDNAEAADRTVDDVLAICADLAGTPGMGRCRTDITPDLRSFPATHAYLIYYREIEGGIEVELVLHAARDVDALL